MSNVTTFLEDPGFPLGLVSLDWQDTEQNTSPRVLTAQEVADAAELLGQVRRASCAGHVYYRQEDRLVLSRTTHAVSCAQAGLPRLSRHVAAQVQCERGRDCEELTQRVRALLPFSQRYLQQHHAARY